MIAERAERRRADERDHFARLLQFRRQSHCVLNDLYLEDHTSDLQSSLVRLWSEYEPGTALQGALKAPRTLSPPPHARVPSSVAGGSPRGTAAIRTAARAAPPGRPWPRRVPAAPAIRHRPAGAARRGAAPRMQLEQRRGAAASKPRWQCGGERTQARARPDTASRAATGMGTAMTRGNQAAGPRRGPRRAPAPAARAAGRRGSVRASSARAAAARAVADPHCRQLST